MTDTGSTKPYLLRAIYEWAEDNGLTPQVLVNANEEGVEVPSEHVVNGQIILNISATAVRMHQMDNEAIRFSARFNGTQKHITLPLDSVLAIFARENSQGIFFEETPTDGFGPDPSEPEDSPSKATKVTKPTPISGKSKPSHLKIIK